MDNPIIKPIITEKTIALAKDRKYTFIVDSVSNKKSIVNAVEKAFNVKVLRIATSVMKGRTKRVGKRRNEVSVSPYKKAVVKLSEGQKIDLFELAS